MNQVAQKTFGAAINLQSVRKYYGAFRALDGINLHVSGGEFMTFLGPSGSGKTTTLNLIAGFTELTDGQIRVGERDVGGLPAHLRNFGVVFQHYALFPHMSVFKNVAYPLKLRGVPSATCDQMVRRVLEMVKLEDFGHRYPSELSGGQQQRVAFARAIVFNPPLLLMDEPLGALDKKLREWLQLEIKRIHRELGTTFIYVTHDQEEALILSDRIAIFNKGRIEQVGTGRQLYDDPATLFVGRFIGESTILRGKAEVRGGQTALSIGGQTAVAPSTTADEGDKVILVRPENIVLAAPGSALPDSHNRLRGTVSEALYLGSSAKYEIRLSDGSVVVARTEVAENPFALGDEVDVTWAVAHSKLLVDDKTGEANEL
jgi:putative spermidine/putrescine transport system ATP-binding protein